jgi:predicted DNA-binding transcriptional regulator YafY
MTRQWQVLRDIDAARTGITIPKLAASRGVHQRTIRRDIEALSHAGFPLYDDKVNGTTMWKLRARPFRGLEELGLSLMELCALYFSRTLLATLAGAPFQDEADRALTKIERALPAGCRRFLDAMPSIIKAKSAGRKKTNERRVRDVVERVTGAILQHRRVEMIYESHSSLRVKDYLVEPLRISYADGGTYLTGYVPGYSEVRNFAVERIRTLGVTDEKFTPRPLSVEPFANSIGVFSGTPERIEIQFEAAVADYVSNREWHTSQTFEPRQDGSVVMRLDVCVDRPLKSWLLGFGSAARVLAPSSLAADVVRELEATRARYESRIVFPMLKMSAREPFPVPTRASG